MSDTLSVRLASSVVVQQDGWQTLETLPEVGFGPGVDDDNGAVDRKSLRLSALWEPTENFSALVTGDYGRDKSEVLGFKHAGNLLAATPGQNNFCSFATIGVRDEFTCASFGQVRDSVGGTPLDPEIEIIQDQNPDPRTILANFGTGNEVDAESWGVSASLNWQLGRTTLTSITGYREFDRFQPLDQGGAPLNTNEVRNYDDITSFTQEVRLASDDSWGPFNWIVGAFYSDDDNDFLSTADFRDHVAFSGFFTSFSTQQTEGISVFSQVDWNLAPDWRLSLGARYTDEDRSFTFGGFIEGTGPVPIADFRPDDINTEEVGGRISLDYMATDDVMLFASFNRGFKSGGFPAAIAFSIPQLLPFEREVLLAYETGLKSNWLDGRIRFNTSVYYYDWEDMQAATAVDRIDPVSGQGVRVVVLTNAGDAEVLGIESELTWQVSDEFLLYLGANWMDGEITSGNFDGDDLAHAPDFTVNGFVRYDASARLFGMQPFLHLDASYTSSQQFILPNHPGAVEDGYTIVNARAGLRTEDGRWEFAGWIRNLTDELYASEIFGPGSSFLPGRILFGPPQTIGVSVSLNY